MNPTLLLFDFTSTSNLQNWYVVDDGVMGGRSAGQFSINEAGNGLFQGRVSLENNGGFSSVRYMFPVQSVSSYQRCVIRLKGDGKQYQFRVKSQRNDRHSYIVEFATSGEWETIEIPLSDMYPGFRGMKLSIPNYPGEVLSEIAFLIGNKKAETFRLEIDQIGLE